MDEDIEFMDVERGIFGGKNGNLYLTEPGTCELKDEPFVVPYPYKIYVKEEYDPFAVIFTESGYIYILNFQTQRWHLKTLLPPKIGVIDSLEIKDDGNSVLLKSSQSSYIYQNGWVCIQISLKPLIVKEDQKVFAQSAQLENEICAAKFSGNFEAFQEAMKRYLVFLADYTTADIFIQTWYDVIKQKYPSTFSSEDIHKLWIDCIDLISTIQNTSSMKDELLLTIGE